MAAAPPPYPGTTTTAPFNPYPSVPQPQSYPATNVNLQVDPQVLLQLTRIANALEKIVEKMGHGFD